MRTQKAQQLARRVVLFYQKHGPKPARTVAHFAEEGESASTIYGIIKRFRSGGKIEYSAGRGSIPKHYTNENIETARDFIRSNPRATYSSIGAHLGMAKPTAYVLCQRGGIQNRKRSFAPPYVKDQAERCIKAADFILKRTAPKNGKKLIIMDDESYVFCEPDQNPNCSFYKFVDGESVADDARFKRKNNFSDKWLVWQAISEDGRGSPIYICEGTMNGEIYKMVLETILVPWIKEEFGIENVLFWPDMASCHYKDCVTKYLKKEGVEFVLREQNAPKLPQARPIERYWALCKRLYAKSGARPQTLAEFEARWLGISKRVLHDSGKNLFANLRKKLRAVRRDGPLGPLKLRN